MDYKKILDDLIEKFGKEQLGKFIVEAGCLHSFGMSEVGNCGICPLYCPECLTKALGLEEAGE
jgi:hypothetical protein